MAALIVAAASLAVLLSGLHAETWHYSTDTTVYVVASHEPLACIATHGPGIYAQLGAC